MLLLIALSAALGAADRPQHASADQPRTGWSQPMQPATGSQDAPPPDLPQGAGPRATSGGPLFDMVAVTTAARRASRSRRRGLRPAASSN